MFLVFNKAAVFEKCSFKILKKLRLVLQGAKKKPVF